MKKIKKISVFTSIRSEYGLLKSLLVQIKNDKDFELNLIVGGAHFLDEYGNTVQEIENDGFDITFRAPFLFNDGQKDVNTRSIAALSCQINEYFRANETDLLVVLGDRFELLPVVTAALVLNIPIAHISGGEITEGAIDNQVRHAISKMANLHFVATEQFKNNLISMGEEPWRINICGELGLDEIVKLNLIQKEELFADLKLNPDLPVICATFHTETIDNKITPDFVDQLFNEILAKTEFQILVTAANFDFGGNDINRVLNRLNDVSDRISYCKSLGKLRYFSLLNVANLVLGNSSSGLVEAKSFDIPVLNVGKRQQGRLANINVINTSTNIDEIMGALKYASSKEFKEEFSDTPNVYGKGNSALSITEFIKKWDKDDLLLKRTVFN